jgi:hypothetical protein
MPEPEPDPDPDRQAVLTVLTTEHFALQGSRGSTISESTSRAGLFVGALSSVLVALGFIGQASDMGEPFVVFALVVLPTLYALGLFTFVRLVESSVEDIGYARAINRIRAYYLDVVGPAGKYISMNAHDDVYGVLANMGMARPSPWQLHFTLAAMVATLDAVVGGTAVAFLVGALGATLAVSAVVGAAVAVASFLVFTRWQRRYHDAAREGAEVLFPTPA